jgi:hypothetical protein
LTIDYVSIEDKDRFEIGVKLYKDWLPTVSIRYIPKEYKRKQKLERILKEI